MPKNSEEAEPTPVQALIQALRSPLPKGFEWDFQWSRPCAWGSLRLTLNVAAEAGGADVDHPLSGTEIDGLAPLYWAAARDVTPAMVADALERLVSPPPSAGRTPEGRAFGVGRSDAIGFIRRRASYVER